MKTAVLIVSVMGAGLLAVAASAQEGQKDVSSGKVKELQQERIAALNQMADAASKLFRLSRMTPDVAYDARLLLLKAEVNAAENESDRVKLYENYVDVMKNFEAMAEAMKAGAQGTQIMVLKAKAMRLEGEIALEQAKTSVEKEAGSKRVKELQQERIAALKQMADVASKLLRNARTTVDVAYDAWLLMMNAEAEVAENESDRIKLYENFVEVAKEYEAIAETQKAGAQGTHAAVLKAKAMRLEAEITLERAKVGAEKDEAANRIKELQQARIAALKELADGAKALYQKAVTTAEQAFDAKLALLQAEAEVAENESDRIKLYENFVDAMKQFEAMAQAHKVGARGTEASVLKAKAMRLEGEIALEQAKANTTK